MQDWTEQEEQQMILRAKEGDPKANYDLCLWALRRSEEEPDEPRWNRLAAKCLVKAAQAGYAPAQERMAELLHKSQDEKAPEPAAPQPEPEPERAPRKPVLLSDARAAAEARRSRGPAPESTARRPSPVVFDPEEDSGEEPEDEEEEENAASGRVSFLGRRSRNAAADIEDDEPDDEEPEEGAAPRWGEKQWRRVEIVCVAVCAALLVLIAVMLITSRSGGGTEPTQSAIPPAVAANAAASPSPEPEAYPSEDVIAEIQAADLEMFPADSEYVNVPTTATVKVDSQSLRLRKGPSTTYTPPICSMDDGTVVSIFANKENWSLVLYEGGEDGPVYGWCSSEYLIVTSGAADSSSVG